MKKVLIAVAAIAFSILAFAGPQQPNLKCDCRNNPDENDGSCIPITGDNSRSGFYCEHTGGNKDCYETMCISTGGSSGGGGGGVPNQ